MEWSECGFGGEKQRDRRDGNKSNRTELPTLWEPHRDTLLMTFYILFSVESKAIWKWRPKNKFKNNND